MLFVCGCTQNEITSEASTESSLTESTTDESSAVDNSSDFSIPPDTRDDKISECVVMTTDKTEYSVDEKIKLLISTNHKFEHEICFGDGFYFEYYKDGEWHRCEKEFEWKAIANGFGIFEQYETTYIVDISERIDEGYEKYRVVNEFYSDKHKQGLIYSNEFVLVP
jgi:hypothetical protein